MGIFKTINAKKKAAEGFLQNYGANLASNMQTMKPKTNYGAINPFPNPFKKASYKRPVR